MSNRIVSWNPATADQFAQTTNSNLELCRIEQTHNQPGRNAVLVASLPKVNQVTCMEWQNGTQTPILAYGTASGSVNLVNWQGLYEVAF